MQKAFRKRTTVPPQATSNDLFDKHKVARWRAGEDKQASLGSVLDVLQSKMEDDKLKRVSNGANNTSSSCDTQRSNGASVVESSEFKDTDSKRKKKNFLTSHRGQL